MAKRPATPRSTKGPKNIGQKRDASKSSKMKKELSGSFQLSARRNKSGHDGAKGSAAMLRCTGCGAVYFDKHWHSPSLAVGIDRADLADALCEECKLGAKNDGGKVTGFGGEITLEGLADPALRAEVIGVVRNVAKRATHRDPEDRIIKISDAGANVVVTTTENQLAVSIGKQVHRARKGGELHITWSQQDKPVRVRWTAPK